jgi:hypothetical protein
VKRDAEIAENKAIRIELDAEIAENKAMRLELEQYRSQAQAQAGSSGMVRTDSHVAG